MSDARREVDAEVDGEIGDEERLAAALAVLALARAGSAPVGPLARWRAQRLAALRPNARESPHSSR